MDIPGVIWGVHAHKVGSSEVSMDIQGCHLECPWTYRGVVRGVHGHTGGRHGSPRGSLDSSGDFI